MLFFAPALADGFNHYDKNADGVTSADELGEEKEGKMAKIYANGNAVISREEIEQYKVEYKPGNKTYSADG